MSDFDIIPENIWISLEKSEVPKFGLTISFKVEVDIAQEQARNFWRQTDVWFWTYSRKCLNSTQSSGSVHRIICKENVLGTNWYLVLKLFQKIFGFHMKKTKLSKFPISFYKFNSGASKYCKTLWVIFL